MEITFDPAKDAVNTAKHGVSLALASELEWDGLMAQPDTRHDYGELRMIGYVPIGTRVFCLDAHANEPTFAHGNEPPRLSLLRS